MNQKTARIIRWIARIWAALNVAFMLYMFIGHIIMDGIGPVLDFSLRDALMMFFMVLSIAGLALGCERYFFSASTARSRPSCWRYLKQSAIVFSGENIFILTPAISISCTPASNGSGDIR